MSISEGFVCAALNGFRISELLSRCGDILCNVWVEVSSAPDTPLHNALMFNSSTTPSQQWWQSCSTGIYVLKSELYYNLRVWQNLYVFESPFCSPRLFLFDQKYIKNSNNVKYYCILNCNWLLWCAATFSASLLQSSVSHDLQKS